jgi:hypothetical protein
VPNTLRFLVEQGLHEIISKQKSEQKFRLRKARFRGNGLQDEFWGANWQKMVFSRLFPFGSINKNKVIRYELAGYSNTKRETV